MAKKWLSVRLLNPEMCKDCRFGSIAIVDGERRTKCMRRDCDNWDYSSLAPMEGEPDEDTD